VLQAGIGTQEFTVYLGQLPGATLDVRRECRWDGIKPLAWSAPGFPGGRLLRRLGAADGTDCPGIESRDEDAPVGVGCSAITHGLRPATRRHVCLTTRANT